MPTYQYACTECDHAFEQVQSFSDDALTVCPECGGKLRKVFNAVGVVFKGSGFYRTDSRSGREKTAAAKSDRAPAAETKSSSSDSSSGSSSGSGSSAATGSAGSAGSSASGSSTKAAASTS